MINGGIGNLPRFEDSTGNPRTKSLNEPLNNGEASAVVNADDAEEDEADVEGAALILCKEMLQELLYLL